MTANNDESEMLIFGKKKEAEMFMRAVGNASKRTYIRNNSITREGNKIIILPTNARFLIEVGQEYQKLLNP